MSIEHASIADADRHEAKGASTATNGQVAFANGDGTTTFRKINYSDLGTKPTASGYQFLLTGTDTSATQIPSTSNTALQIKFGPTQTTTNVTVGSDGGITFNVTGDYAVRYGLAFSGGTGGSVLFFRVLINGSPLEPTHRVAPSEGEITEFSETLFINATANDKLTIEISSDSSGAAIGGLTQASPGTSGWSATPTADISVYKFKGVN